VKITQHIPKQIQASSDEDQRAELISGIFHLINSTAGDGQNNEPINKAEIQWIHHLHGVASIQNPTAKLIYTELNDGRKQQIA